MYAYFEYYDVHFLTSSFLYQANLHSRSSLRIFRAAQERSQQITQQSLHASP